MAKRSKPPASRPPGSSSPPESTPPFLEGSSDTTGRYLVLFREDTADAAVKSLREDAGLRSIASSADFAEGALDMKEVGGSEAIVFDRLGVAVVEAEPRQLSAVAAADESSPILAVEPERIMYAIADGAAWGEPAPSGPISLEYLRGYRDAIVGLYNVASGGAAGELSAGAVESFADTSRTTWGLLATRVASSSYSGRRVRVAVLDTGLDLQHPDFVGRAVVGQSFIEGEAVDDEHGHGTHCIGTACGPKDPPVGRRYGVAYESHIYAGKVLSNAGRGPDASILAGINWALANGCRVISMSLGSPVRPGETYSPIYEAVARRALEAGTLIVAAAGNEARRNVGEPHQFAVGRPANCPSIMAVAALNSQLRVATFSNPGLIPEGGQIDIAAPGVDIYSSWPMPVRYRIISGTSMATPHVAGIAALLSEANRELGGARLWQLLITAARRLRLPATDIAAGLVQAP